jgi:hypothetical protein
MRLVDFIKKRSKTIKYRVKNQVETIKTLISDSMDFLIKVILCMVETLLTLTLLLASGLGLFVLIRFIVYEFIGPEWLRVNAMLVFLLSGFLLSMGLIKLLEMVQYELLYIRAEEIEIEYRLKSDPEAMKLSEHLRVQ